ncbi:hypothetical protein AB2L27_01970 [Kineococcus sp. LSe6-4]|uniref:DUF2550 family protein n=1 Tax=Kineococcus halophytocola TaxID=3234027 RepID=A0ABV4GW60_9ACTN
MPGSITTLGSGMSHWNWIVIAVVTGTAIGLVAPRLRRRAQRGLHGQGVFEASVRSLARSPHGLSRAWGCSAGAVITDSGDLRWRGRVLAGGRLEDAEARKPRGRELAWLDPWTQVWTVVFDDGTRVEVGVAPGDAHFLRPWRTPTA